MPRQKGGVAKGVPLRSDVAQDADDVTQSPEAGVYVSGLFTDSCRWDARAGALVDPLPGTSYAQLPVVWFCPEPGHAKPPDHYLCPLYKTLVRRGTLSSLGQSTNFVLGVELRSTRPEDYWVQRGAALVCALDS